MRVAIILNAPALTETVEEKAVILVDGAYRFLNELQNKEILAVVGDFDSLGFVPQGVNALPTQKDFTDGEFAVKTAKTFGADEIVIYGAFGGKIEHILGNLHLLKIAKDTGLNAEIRDGATVTLESGKVNLFTKIGKSLSIIPFNGDCKVTNSKGLFYPLNDLTLTCGDTIGISNRTTETEVSFNVVQGMALVIKY